MEFQFKTICQCFECLVSTGPDAGECEKTHNSKKEVILQDLARNVQKVLEITEAEHCGLYNALNSYVIKSSLNGSWSFVVTCLTLLKSICETLMFMNSHEDAKVTEEATECPEMMSVKEQNAVRKAFQFLVALGILPNLVPSLRGLLKTRSRMSHAIEVLDDQASPCLRYQRLVFCLSVICECLQERTLRRILLSSHTSDLMLALLQICYAPIKKLKENESHKEKKETESSNQNGKISAHNSLNGDEHKDFKYHFKKLQYADDLTEKDFISQMEKDREYFSLVLRNFIQLLSPSSLMWELLLLQNSKGSSDSKTKIPLWLKRTCSEMLTNKILEPNGVKNFIQVSLDRMSDADVQSGLLSRHRVEAVARLISENPVQHISSQRYVQGVLEQLMEVLHAEEESSSKVLMTVASSVVLQFSEMNSEVVNRCLTHSVFKAFWKCTSGHLLIFDGEKISSEEEITTCIEDIHKIFVGYSSVLNEDQVRVLLPFYHLLFTIYIKLVNGISFLRSKVQDLLKVILKNCNSDLSTKLLRMAAFEDFTVQNVILVTDLRCEFGDSGNIEIIKCCKQKLEYDDLAEDADLRCQSLVLLLQDMTDTQLRVPFFLELLKGTVSTCDAKEPSNADDVKLFISNLITVNLLENLSEIIGDDLVSDIDEAMNVVKCALECAAHCKDQIFSNEAIMNFLIILSTLLGYKDQLSSAQWKCLKDCLPYVEALTFKQKDEALKSIASDICIAIKTHGAVFEREQSVQKKVKTAKAKSVDANNAFKNHNSDTDYKVSQLQHLENVEIKGGETSVSSKCHVGEKGLATGKTNKHSSSFECAMKDLDDLSIPSRGHGLIALCQLIEKRDAETLSHKKELIEVFQKNLLESDSYIYLSAIRGLSALGNVFADEVLPILLAEFLGFSDKKWEQTLKIGESLLKVCHHLGELTPKYRDKLLSAFLAGARHEDPQVCSSSLSNLGEVCKQLKFAIGPWLHEILFCVTSLLKSEAHLDVKRSATLVITLILRGTGVDSLQMLQNEMKELYNLLRFVHYTAKDNILKLQAQLALEEVNHIVKESFSKKPALIKEIRVLDPL